MGGCWQQRANSGISGNGLPMLFIICTTHDFSGIKRHRARLKASPKKVTEDPVIDIEDLPGMLIHGQKKVAGASEV